MLPLGLVACAEIPDREEKAQTTSVSTSRVFFVRYGLLGKQAEINRLALELQSSPGPTVPLDYPLSL